MIEKKPHKWSEVIKAWSDGKPIQLKNQRGLNEWVDYEGEGYRIPPDFGSSYFEWRVKPENIVIEGEITRNPYFNSGCFSIKPGSNNNIRLEFDPGTYKLVKAEVIG